MTNKMKIIGFIIILITVLGIFGSMRYSSTQNKSFNLNEPLKVNEENFQSEVLNSNIPVIVDFWAAWCGPCKKLSPLYDELSVEYSGKVKFCKLNVD